MRFSSAKGITRKQVLDALGQVDDPDLKKDLVTLGMIKDLEIKGKQVSFSVELTTPACPMKDAIKHACLNAIKLMVDSEAVVNIKMTARVTAAKNNQTLPQVKNIIAISSGKGGVGKSTVATNLAVALARAGAKVGLVDADIYGPSLPILFGFADERPRLEKIGDKDFLLPFERFGVKLMSIGVLVRPEQAVVWRGPMASKALQQLIFDTKWGEIDYLLLDLPPGTGDIHLTSVQALPLTGAVVVTTPQQVAVADARKGAAMFGLPQVQVPILGVVENMAWFSPDDAPDKRYYLFGRDGGSQLAASLQVPLLGQIPLRERICETGDLGKPEVIFEDEVLAPGFITLAQNLAQQIALRNAQMPPTQPVQMNPMG